MILLVLAIGSARAIAANRSAYAPLPHRDHRLAEHLHARGDPEPRGVGGGHAAGAALGGALGDRDAHVAVEVGGGEAERLESANRAVDRSGGSAVPLANPCGLDGCDVGSRVETSEGAIMGSLVSREMRWFLEGPIPDAARDWFDGLPGKGKKVKRSYPRQDIYLAIPDRPDLGLKLREGRLEIKIRSGPGSPCPLLDGAVTGTGEDWQKHKWDYKDRIGEISTPFKKGMRVRLIKSRVQRKYEVKKSQLSPVKMDKKPDEVFLVELTELHSEAVDKKESRSPMRRDWTIACEAIASSRRVQQVLETGVKKLFRAYNGPPLRHKDSYGYPQFALLVAKDLPKAG